MVSVDVKHHVYFIFHFGVNVQGISFRSGASSVPSLSVTSYSLCYSVSVRGYDLAHRATPQRPRRSAATWAVPVKSPLRVERPIII